MRCRGTPLAVQRRVLGIDPSLSATGYAVLEEAGGGLHALVHGAVRTTTATPRASRLLAIHDELLNLVRTWNPTAIAVESPFVAENVRSAMVIGEVRAVVLITAASANIEPCEYSPAEIKQVVTGYGRSDKQQVQDMVRRQVTLDSEPTSFDAVDAIAVAICHLVSSSRKAALGRLAGSQAP
ncbi:MAG: crossover junction endodeoxyribonuclease RuvC [Dehalococcoidia bacterium]|nr:crossover junction endodeoxyribonuclease RuvC [Dehalococcoidia bacterium]